MSKGNASVNFRELVRWGRQGKSGVRGGRKDFYEAEIDSRKIINGRLAVGLSRRVDQASDIMAQTKSLIVKAVDGLNDEGRKIASLYPKRLSSMKKM